jgi:hypothetical protein
MSEWLPIETAPQDGTHILVYLDEEMLGSRVVNAALRGEGTNGISTIGSLFAFDAPKPTHWMPLPEPPSEDETDG